jgi:hypothetical protein
MEIISVYAYTHMTDFVTLYNRRILDAATSSPNLGVTFFPPNQADTIHVDVGITPEHQK